jgi:hypothetical protein
MKTLVLHGFFVGRKESRGINLSGKVLLKYQQPYHRILTIRPKNLQQGNKVGVL